jgi:hypothetical protein
MVSMCLEVSDCTLTTRSNPASDYLLHACKHAETHHTTRIDSTRFLTPEKRNSARNFVEDVRDSFQYHTIKHRTSKAASPDLAEEDLTAQSTSV